MASVSVGAAESTLGRPPSLLRRLLRHRLFMTGVVLFGAMVFLAVFADLISILPPEKMQVRLRFRPPQWGMPFGTDNYGRDIWSRAAFGARLSLAIGLEVVVLTGTLGTAI